MGIFPARFLALIYLLATTNLVTAKDSSSSTYSLGDDITDFIPLCAQSCFASFLAANFPVSACTTSPTLDCLCTHKSSTGYAAGEGAIQCITAEIGLGICTGDDASSSVGKKAYNMCGGKANALPNTNTILEATIIVASLPPKTTQTTSHTSSKASNTVSSIPSTTADSTTSISDITSQPTSDSASTTELNAADPTAPASADGSSSAAPVAGTQLSSPQLAGIVVASVGAAVIAIVAIAIAACLRRRRRIMRERNSNTNSLPFQNDPSNGEKYFPTGLGNGSVGPFGAKKVAPPRFPMEYGDPGITLPTDQIGMAVSPEVKKYVLPTNGLPEKPKLRLYVPPEPVAKDGPLPMPRNKNESYDQGVPNRDSAMTQFEEDNTPYTPFSYEENNTIYYGLPNGEVKSSLPTTNPATPPRALTSGNSLRPQEIRNPARSFSQPLQPGTTTSSVYSSRSSPRDSAANYQTGRQPQQSPYRAYTPYSQPSQQEAAELPTDFNNQALQPEPTLVPAPLRRKSHVNDRRSADLSPVVESPVSYPKIPKLSPTFAYPPPKQPNFQRLRDPRASAGSGMSAESTSSSLLEKRRGKEQADALILGRVDGKPTGGKNGWRVVPVGAGQGLQNGSGRSFMNLQGERGQVPMSPSPWELTPKKMGDDLFLTQTPHETATYFIMAAGIGGQYFWHEREVGVSLYHSSCMSLPLPRRRLVGPVPPREHTYIIPRSASGSNGIVRLRMLACAETGANDSNHTGDGHEPRTTSSPSCHGILSACGPQLWPLFQTTKINSEQSTPC
ncbi:hypothetical protein V494_07144 [Pseudogymnoascus sp. VKM F-4513 (FW-928)]|nr:hypothetical protein V494_07144 [Pseudogymnoascus sp. VKM F-4513 (FW-928)]